MFALTIGFYIATIATASRYHAVGAFLFDKVSGVVVAVFMGELGYADAVRILEFTLGDIHCARYVGHYKN